MTHFFETKVDELKKIFLPLSLEEKYAKIISFGATLPPFPPAAKTAANLIPGCQSLLYLHTTFQDGKLFFTAHADALISAGLAAILIYVYSGLTPQEILTSPPTFLKELGILNQLSPGRSNGLAHIHLRMKQEALQKIASF